MDRFIALFLTLFLVLCMACPPVQAQTLQAEGVAGYTDKGDRHPILTVRTVQRAGGVSILADATIANETYLAFPIQFEFFVNRKLFATQLRSPELPGPVGVDVGNDRAQVPFNYAVVATVLVPNRTFRTVIQGAVFQQNLVAELDCFASLDALSDSPRDYDGSVTTSQSAGGSFSLDFSASGDDGSIAITSEVAVNGTNASAVVAVDDNGSTSTFSTTGTASFDSDGNLLDVDLATSDGNFELSCD